MSDLEPRRRSGLSRKSRENRAFTLVLATGGLAFLTLVLIVLAIAGVGGFGWAIVTGVLAAAGVVMLRRTLSS
jgi:hypothetical protein